jgi:hypothetical protein
MAAEDPEHGVLPIAPQEHNWHLRSVATANNEAGTDIRWKKDMELARWKTERM